MFVLAFLEHSPQDTRKSKAIKGEFKQLEADYYQRSARAGWARFYEAMLGTCAVGMVAFLAVSAQERQADPTPLIFATAGVIATAGYQEERKTRAEKEIPAIAARAVDLIDPVMTPGTPISPRIWAYNRVPEGRQQQLVLHLNAAHEVEAAFNELYYEEVDA